MSDHFCPYEDKTVEEVIHDYVVVRGDLSEQYARDQLAAIVTERISAAEQRGRVAALREAADALYTPDNPPRNMRFWQKVRWHMVPDDQVQGLRFRRWLRARADHIEDVS